MQKLAAVAVTILLTACATQAPSQGYRPANYAGAPWVISGSVNLLTGSASIDINSQRAAAGQRGGVLRGLVSGAVMFVRMYVLRLGFLCGGAGFLYCAFIALEAFFRYAALHYDRDTLSDSVGR